MPSAYAALRLWRPDMARRSYLERVAQPLPPGQPVLFAAPRPVGDAARPAAAPNAQTAPKPKPASVTAPAPKPTSTAPAESTTAAAPRPRRAAARNAIQAVPSPLKATPPAPTPSIPAAATAAPSSPDQALTNEAKVPIDSAADLISEKLPPSAVLPPHIPQVVLSKPTGTTPPRIHIGTIEVRTSPSAVPAPPPLPAPSQQPPSHALSGDAGHYLRAYGWRFGLIQG